MPVLLDRDSLHIDPCRRHVPVTQRVLRLDDASRGLTQSASERVSCLVQVDIPEAGPPGVHLDPFGKGMPGQLLTAMQIGPIVRGPQWRLRIHSTQTS